MASESKKGFDYEVEILDCIRDHPGGVTITDIANLKEYSRNTVSKYVSILELKNLIISRKIGAYKLYFTSERRFIPRRAIVAFYQGLLSGIAEEISENKEDIFKNIGLNMDKFITFPVGSRFPKEIKQSKKGSYKDLFQYYAEIYDSMDYVIEDFAEIEVEINEKGNKATYTFKEVKLLEADNRRPRIE